MLISEILRGYRERRYTPVEMMERVLARIDAAQERHIWIERLPSERVLGYARAVEGHDMASMPLYGVPFAIKDNIDLAGVPTTAACAAYAYLPKESATVVAKLLEAGAIPIGKTNLDQFATGLVGTRSPYGVCTNALDPRYIAGGSSSGSAVAVACGLVSFALGTDTAGSGRIPAGFNNIVGLKPSCGLLSTSGVVPACRSLDCVSIFALTAADARRVLEAAKGYDESDAYSRRVALRPAPRDRAPRVRAAVPLPHQLQFFGDAEYAHLYADTCERGAALGWSIIQVDIAPLLEAARLLYEGPWVAERHITVERLLRSSPAAIHEVTRAVISSAEAKSAADTFRAQYRLQEIRRAAAALWQQMDVLLVPTAPTIYPVTDVLADPLRLNTNLGYYTNFVNLLDLAAIAVPAGFRRDGLPFGVTLIGPAASDRVLLALGSILHAACAIKLGALDLTSPASEVESSQAIPPGHVAVVVCGAHMSGLALNHQLQERDGYFVARARTAPKYRFYALSGGPPKRPGLVRVADAGAAIAVEVWALPVEHFGSFVSGIPAPLAIGKVELEDGTWHSGFVCETYGVAGAEEITALGSWREFLARS